MTNNPTGNEWIPPVAKTIKYIVKSPMRKGNNDELKTCIGRIPSPTFFLYYSKPDATIQKLTDAI